MKTYLRSSMNAHFIEQPPDLSPRSPSTLLRSLAAPVGRSRGSGGQSLPSAALVSFVKVARLFWSLVAFSLNIHYS